MNAKLIKLKMIKKRTGPPSAIVPTRRDGAEGGGEKRARELKNISSHDIIFVCSRFKQGKSFNFMTQLEKTIGYWRESADNDLGVAKKLFGSKDYDYCLFFCHLALEKLLKALVIQKTDRHAPLIHSLVRLAELAELELSPNQIADMEEITRFNISGRYPEEKAVFRKSINKPFANKYLSITQSLIIWLKKHYLKK